MNGYREVVFDGERAPLHGRLYEHSQPRPAVVMAHGFSATAEGMVADRYAEVLHAAGVAVLLYDHEGLGESGGEPRQVINRWLQCRGYRHALGFAAVQPSVDPLRMALWGDSFSASIAITVAAYDHRVAAMVVQVPSCGSEPGPGDPDGSAYATFGEVLANADVIGDAELGDPLPVVSRDQRMTLPHLVPITAYHWFTRYGQRSRTWRNVAIRATLPTTPAYATEIVVSHLRCPTLWIIAHNDEMPGSATDVALRCFQLAGGAKQKLMIDGGHFGLLYDTSPIFDQVSRAQAAFFTSVLGTA